MNFTSLLMNIQQSTTQRNHNKEYDLTNDSLHQMKSFYNSRMKDHYLLKNVNINKLYRDYKLSISSIEKMNQYLDNKMKCINSNMTMKTIKEKTNFTKRQRIPFSAEEDEKIKYLVNKYGTHNWKIVSSYMGERTAKQCRDRYFNYLDGDFIKCEWTQEEDNLLKSLIKNIGPKWSIMKKYFPHRNHHSIKNRWQYFLSKQTKKQIYEVENQNFEIEKNEEPYENYLFEQNESTDEFEDFLWNWDEL